MEHFHVVCVGLATDYLIRKTQVALEYAHNRKECDRHCSIFWVHADSETSFVQDYNSIARKLELPSRRGRKDVLQAVCDKLESNPNWVLVIDGADDLTWFGVTPRWLASSPKTKVNLTSFIPKCSTGTGTVLWTSRDRQVCSPVGEKQAINVFKMTSDEAVALLSTIRHKELTEDEYTEVGELLDELDHISLAISQVAAYIRKPSVSVGNCLTDIRKMSKTRWKILRKSEYNRHRREQGRNNVLETWDVSVQHLRNMDELIYDVLHTLTFVDNQNIPFELICETARHADGFSRRRLNARNTSEKNHRKKEEKAQLSKEDIETIVTRLCDFSFLTSRTSDPVVYDMHKLVQEAARYRLQKGGDEVKNEAHFAQVAFEIVNDVFPKGEENFLKIEPWERCEQYLAHALQTATWAELHGGEVHVAGLLRSISDYLGHRNRWREKETVDEKIVHLMHKKMGERHPDTLTAMRCLGLTYSKQEKWKEAEELFRTTLCANEEVLGEKHPRTLRSMHSLCWTILEQGRHEEAENLCRQILQLRTEILGEKHLDTIDSLYNLGAAIECQGRHDEAERILRGALVEEPKRPREMKDSTGRLKDQPNDAKTEGTLRQVNHESFLIQKTKRAPAMTLQRSQLDVSR